ncbi:MAG: N-acetyltransferase, partial [Pseudomonadota bacterium]
LALSIVAEINGRIVGHAALSFMQSPEDSLALAPVAVTPGMQGLGVGSAMIRECITRAWHEEAAILFVLGEPPYYARFGFNAADAVAFESPYSGEFWLALIRPGAAPQPGPAVHAKAFAGLA